MLGIGPLIILDKSVLQMLSADEFSLLTDYFRLVVPPVLIEEIIADLELKANERTIPEDVVRRLASRMAEARGYESVHYLYALGGSLLGGYVPMCGPVPIGNRPNAFHTDDREGFIYDKVPEQQFWERLASGRFDAQDKERAQRWRRDLSQIDLEKIHRDLSGQSRQAFGKLTSCDEIVRIVDLSMENADATVQLALVRGAALMAGFDQSGQSTVLRRWEALNRPKFRDFAPYAAYVSRLHATFAVGVSSGVITTRATNAIDLQYLCYAPFCMVFASADRFHETMWPAVAGRNSFVHGAELKLDLNSRCEQMAAQSASAEATARRGIRPPRNEGSVITRMCDIYLIPEPTRRDKAAATPRTIDELDESTRERLKKAFEAIDRRRKP